MLRSEMARRCYGCVRESRRGEGACQCVSQTDLRQRRPGLGPQKRLARVGLRRRGAETLTCMSVVVVVGVICFASALIALHALRISLLLRHPSVGRLAS